MGCCTCFSCLLYRFFRPPFRHSGLDQTNFLPAFYLLFQLYFIFFKFDQNIFKTLNFGISFFFQILQDFTKHENQIPSLEKMCILITGSKNKSFFKNIYICFCNKKICAPNWPGICHQDRLCRFLVMDHIHTPLDHPSRI